MNCELLWNSQSERAAIWGLGSGRKRNGQREKSLKILGVTFTDKLSVSEHVDDVISSSALSMYAITVLRSHGMAELLALQQVFCAVVISRLTYAAPAWRGFTNIIRPPAYRCRSTSCKQIRTLEIGCAIRLSDLRGTVLIS